MPSLADINIHFFALKPGCPAIACGAVLRSSPDTTNRLDVTNADLRPFDVSMEQLGERLASQPRCYFEWDGSFVWTGEDADSCWTLSGMIYDIGKKISRVELRGNSPSKPVHEITSWLQLPLQELACQQVSSGAFFSGLELEKLWNA